jgi:hypothetical protein
MGAGIKVETAGCAILGDVQLAGLFNQFASDVIITQDECVRLAKASMVGEGFSNAINPSSDTVIDVVHAANAPEGFTESLMNVGGGGGDEGRAC